MNSKAGFAPAFRRAITMSLPGQIMAEYYYSTGCGKHPLWPSGGGVFIGKMRGPINRVATIEASDCGSLRAVFEGEAISNVVGSDAPSSVAMDAANVTPWFPYSDRLSLAELVDDRIRALSIMV